MRRARHAAALAAALFAAVLGAGPGRAQDGTRNTGLDRLTLRQEQLGWEGVGRLELGSSAEYCTGTLIDTTLVLTAAHCVYDPRRGGAPRPPETLVFRAGYADGSAIADRQALRVAAHPRFDPRAAVGLDLVRYDVALVELASPIPAATAAPFPVGRPADAGAGRFEVSVVSYAAGRDEALSWQRRCGVVGRDEGLFAFDCDVAPGSSGAPVFDRSQGRARIVSIISAGGTGEGGMVAFGMELPALVEALKTELRNRPGPGIRAPRGGAGTRAGGARFLRPPQPQPQPPSP